MITRLHAVSVPGPAGTLEGVVHEREGRRHALAALVCHPHPLYGGTLHNKVVHRLGTTLHDLGAEVLRFNFRGVGKSQGVFDEGQGELEDARAAVAFLRQRYPEARLWLAGFSFGAWVAARLATSDPAIERVILIAPPVTRTGFEGLRESALPKLVVQGSMDTFCPLPALQEEFPRWAEPKELVLIEGAGHFFDRRLGDLSRAIQRALAQPAEAARA